MAAVDTPTPSRRSRLSVSHANALTNFSALQTHFNGRRLVVFLDYDGTLTPIVNDPAKALLSPAMKETLQQLRERFTTGVISGRSLDKIQNFVSIPQLYYAGSHGFDIAGPNGTSIQNKVAADFLAELQQVRDTLSERIADIPGAQVEDNIYSVSLHYRYALDCCINFSLIAIMLTGHGHFYERRNADSKYHDQIAKIAADVSEQHPTIR